MSDPARTGSPDNPGHKESKNPASDPPTISPSCTPQQPFPAVVNAYYQLSLAGLKKFFICGGREEDRICLVDVHTGYSCKPPLGSRPGVHLHRGPSPEDPVLAAAGDESRFSARVYALDNTSVILLPPLEDQKNNSQQVVNEPMQARSAGGAVSFGFSVEVGPAMRRAKFEWVKEAKGEEVDGAEIKAGAYKLTRSLARSEGEGSVSSLKIPQPEVVAVLTFVNVWSSLKHAFSLDFLGNGPVLGERWALMAVMTALRLWALRVNGRTTKAVVAAGEKDRGA